MTHLASLFNVTTLILKYKNVATTKPECVGQKGVFKILQLCHAFDDVMPALQILPDL